MIEKYERGADFARWAQYLLRSNSRSEAASIAERSGASPRLVNVTKAAIAGMTLGDPDTGALADIGIVSSGFVASLANIGVFDRLLSDMVRVPLDAPGVRISSTALVGDTPLEGTAKAITRLNFTATQLARLKASCIIVVSRELVDAMSAGAAALISRELRNGVVGATDLRFLADISSGISLTPPTGSTAAAVLTDLGTLLASVTTHAGSRLYLVVSSAIAKRLAVKADTAGTRAFPEMGPQGGALAGIPVIVSDHLPTAGSPATSAIMLIDAAQIAADSEGVVLDQTQHASLEMAVPTVHGVLGGIGSPEQSGGTQLVSMFQTNSRGLRAERFFGFRRLRDTAVSILDGGGW